MSAYVVYTMLELTDPDLFADYRKAIEPLIESYGARRLAAAAKFDVAEGEWPGDIVTILEFDDKAALEHWYNSEEVSQVMAMRQKAARGNLIIVEGL